MDREHVRAFLCRLAVLIFLLLLAIYVGSYAYLSRRGMCEAKKYDTDGFLYVPLDEALRKKDLSHHQYLVLLYKPLNAIDHAILGTDGPVLCLMFDIS